MKTQENRSKRPSWPTICGITVATMVPSMAVIRMTAMIAASTSGRLAVLASAGCSCAKDGAVPRTGSDTGGFPLLVPSTLFYLAPKTWMAAARPAAGPAMTIP